MSNGLVSNSAASNTTVLSSTPRADAPAQLRALLRVRRPSRVFAYDQDVGKPRASASRLGAETALEIVPVADLPQAIAASDIDHHVHDRAAGFHVGCKTAIVLREAGFDAMYMKGGHSAWKAIAGAVKPIAEQSPEIEA
jgi:hypothetical protein